MARVLTDPEPTLESRRWPWAVKVEVLATAPRLSRAPTIHDIAVSSRSLGRHSHIRLSDAQGDRAAGLFSLG